MTDEERIQNLEQLLRDERALRRAAESRVAELTGKAATWRRRAEERAERIERLLAAPEAPRLQRLARSLRRGLRAPSQTPRAPSQTPRAPSEVPRALEPPQSTAPSARDATHPWLPVVRVAAAVQAPELRVVIDAMDAVALDDDGFAEADLVVVEPEAYVRLPEEARVGLADWAVREARQPLVVWATESGVPSELRGLLRDGDLVAVAAGAADDIAGSADILLPGSFDPARHRPDGRPAPRPIVETMTRDGAVVHSTTAGVAAVSDCAGLLDRPPTWLVELAASGTALVPHSLPATTDLAAAGTAARRWAYRHHAPWQRAAALLAAAGISAPHSVPRVAGLLVSHRPDDLPHAIARFLRQGYPATELVVGVHGAAVSADVEKALAAADVPTELLVFDPAMTLGECLNRAAETTSAPILAKIDDDDHYGPAYIEDGVQALMYSGAPIVGKGAQFTYVADADRTVLRRHRDEDTFIDGSPTGATLVVQRSLWERVGFPHRPRRVDVLFVRAARRLDATVYANSRWEFCYVRRGDRHTWATDDTTFLAGAEPAWSGFHPERTEVSDLLPGV